MSHNHVGLMTRKGALRAGAAAAAAGAGVLLGRPRPAPAQTAAAVGTPGAILGGAIAAGGGWEVVDLSVTTGEEYPVNFPGDPQFDSIPLSWFKRRRGPTGTGNSGAVKEGVAAVSRYEITEHTGTQVDFPPHFVPPPGVNIPGARGNAFGRKTGDRYQLSALMGAAVVVDLRDVLARHKAKGKSAQVSRAWLERWEARHGRFGAGEVPLLYSGYTDLYFKRFPDRDRTQDRLLWKPLVDKSEPGWVVLSPAAVELLFDRGVAHIATDAPSFGAAEDPQPTHVAGLERGMTWTESTIGLGRLPLRGAFYVAAPYKVQDQQAAIARGFAFSPKGAARVQDGTPLKL